MKDLLPFNIHSISANEDLLKWQALFTVSVEKLYPRHTILYNGVYMSRGDNKYWKVYHSLIIIIVRIFKTLKAPRSTPRSPTVSLRGQVNLA